jgi:integrase
MARPSKTAAVDFGRAHALTHGLLERATCPADRPFALLRDTEAKGLRLRVTTAGGRHWQFETRLRGGKLFTRSLGEWPAVELPAARAEAHRLRGMTQQGIDPREVERQEAEVAAAAAAERAKAEAAAAARREAEAVTVAQAWAAYLAERRPLWGDLHYRDHLDKARPGGELSKRRGSAGERTKPGPLASLMPLRLVDLTPAAVEAWAAREGQTRASSARLAWRLLSVFLTWCAEQPAYAWVLPARNPAKTRRARESLGTPGVKSDVLQREQLAPWFEQVRQLRNPAIAAALQVMLLTGARPGEVLSLRWIDVDTQWRGLTIRDKMEGSREIPLTPYVAELLAALPRRNEWVFSSSTSESGRLSEPNTPHGRACSAAGIEGLTLHGLRRSFASLTEWLEIPAGVVAQIQGHKPSATAEKHYKRRPLELLRLHHERIEAWILERAGVAPAQQQQTGEA